VFNEVFSKAWLKAISPESIISGFRVCRIYPFNPTVIVSKCPESSSKKDTSSNVQGSCNSEHKDGKKMELASSFTPEEQKLFLRKYEEGFNLPDLRYISWLRPEADFTVFSTETSLLDFFPESTPLDAIAVCDDSSNTKVAEIEDPTSIGTTFDEAITPRREKQIGNLTP